jgi:MFS family permease
MLSANVQALSSRALASSRSAIAPLLIRHRNFSTEAAPKKVGFIDSLRRENSVASETYNRWLCVPAAVGVQVSIGSLYSWSIFNGPLTKELGVLSSVSSDWALGEVTPIFSVTASMLGIGAWFFGQWVERVGPRMAGVLAGTLYGGGLMLSSIGTQLHALPLLYLGYGLMGGLGFALGYLSPVSTLIKWFPERRGMATGLAIFGFGAGAMLGAPLDEFFLKQNRVAPTYLGPADSVNIINEGGARFVEVAGEMKEVVVATAADLKGPFADLAQGVYLAGTGDTGVATTFMTLGGLYFCSITLAALSQRVPAEGYAPPGYVPPTEEDSAKRMQAVGSVDADTVIKTPQFYLFWATIMGYSFAGVSVISCAKTIMMDIFQPAFPELVTGSFAAAFVMAISAANMSGRLGWATASDYLGRKNTYLIFGGIAAPVCVMIPYLTNWVAMGTAGSYTPLYLFYGGIIVIITFYGGLLAVLPAYLADIFGLKHVGAIHGRQLTGWSFSALAGPYVLTSLRKSAYNEYSLDLVSKIDPAKFQERFGSPASEAQALIDANTVTINRLMEIAPAGTMDPTPLLYDKVLYTMAGVYCVALTAAFAMKPVDKKYTLEYKEAKRLEAEAAELAAKPAASDEAAATARQFSTMIRPQRTYTVRDAIDVDFSVRK